MGIAKQNKYKRASIWDFVFERYHGWNREEHPLCITVVQPILKCSTAV